MKTAFLCVFAEYKLTIGLETYADEACDVIVLQVFDLLDLEQQLPIDLDLRLVELLDETPRSLRTKE